MAKQKLTQVTVQGLATNPNPNALPAGSCAVLNNAVMRRPGTITPTPGWRKQNGSTLAGYKLLYSDFDQKVLAVSSDRITPWTLPSTFDTAITQLPLKTDGTKRNLVFLPGRTQTAFSHFRSFITEQSGVVTNLERWAGLPPPAAMYAFTYASSNGFLLNTQGVAYRAHFSLESTDPTAPYIVDGPVSAIGGVLNETGSTCGAQILAYAPPNEPFVIPTNCKLYINIYRSTQAAVTYVTELADDFRRVAQIEITSFTPTFTPIFVDEVTDDARANGIPLYTNGIGQLGGQASKFAPPAASDVCVFKDTMFYVNRSSLPVLTMTVPGPYGVLLSDHDRTIGIGARPVFTAATTSGSAAIVFSSASDVIGVVPGQLLSMSGIPDSSYVVSVVGTTVTVSHNATVTATGVSGTFYDMIKVKVPGYAGGLPVTQNARVLFFDFDIVAAGTLPGFRQLHPAVDTERDQPGIELQYVYTWPASGVLDDGFETFVTNGQNYYPAFSGNYVTETSPTKSLIDVRPNRVFYSATGEPEAVPLANFKDVGSGSILKTLANQSALFFFCTDGLWKITGDGTDFSVYQIDPTTFLVHPDAVGSLNNLIYAWITDGIATVTEDGAVTISTDALGPQFKEMLTVAQASNFPPPYSWGISLCGDSFRNEVWLISSSFNLEVPEDIYSYCVTYNDDTKNFSNQAPVFANGNFLSAVYAPNVSRVAFLTGGSGVNSDAYLPSDYGGNIVPYYLSLEIWFNPLQTEDKGVLKQWMDVNFFVANYAASGSTDLLKARFNARAEATDSTANTVNINNMAVLSRDIHFFVPRRTALSDQQQIGLKLTSGDPDDPDVVGFYLEVQGFTMRYRNASDTLKK